MSNHPPNIIRNLPESVSRRLSQISSDEAMFNEAAAKPSQSERIVQEWVYDQLDLRPIRFRILEIK